MLPSIFALALLFPYSQESVRTSETVDLAAKDREFCRATEVRGLEGWLAWFDGEAVIFPPRGPLITGSAELRRYYEGLDLPPLLEYDNSP